MTAMHTSVQATKYVMHENFDSVHAPFMTPDVVMTAATAFGEALSLADVVVVTDVYAAREAPEPGVDATLVLQSVHGPSQVRYVPALADVPTVLVPDLLPGDLVITMGAGDITTLGPRILGALGG